MKRLKNKPVDEAERGRWYSHTFLVCVALCGLATASCGQIKKYLESRTEVHIKDSTVVNIKDSTVIHTKSVYKTYTGLLDTLRISDESGRGSMTAWADTAHNVIAGSLTIEPFKEKTRIEYRDKIVYRDSIKIEEKTKEVPVKVPTTPKWCWRLLGFNLLVVLAAGVWIYLKIQKKKFLLK